MNKVILAIFFGSIVLLAGCGQKSFVEKQTEKGIEQISGKETDVELENGKVTITDESGLVIEAAKKGMSIPEDFPKDIYIIDGEVVSVMQNQIGPGSFSISINTEKNVKESFELYKKKLPAQGWKIEEAAHGQDAEEELAMITAEKNDQGFLVSISQRPEEKNRTLVVLNIHEM